MVLSPQYIAGFFDGEGCISSQEYYHPEKYIKNPRINLQICITNTNSEILQEIQQIYGGLIYEHSKVNGTTCYALKMVGKERMRNFLESILPYSIVKRGDILLGLQYVETLRDENLGCIPLKEDVHQLRREIHNKLRKRKSSKSHKTGVQFLGGTASPLWVSESEILSVRA